MMNFFNWIKNKLAITPLDKYVAREVHILELERIKWLSKMHHAMHMVAYHEDLIGDMESKNYGVQEKVLNQEVGKQKPLAKTTGVFNKGQKITRNHNFNVS
jgi:hypothetical protein